MRRCETERDAFLSYLRPALTDKLVAGIDFNTLTSPRRDRLLRVAFKV